MSREMTISPAEVAERRMDAWVTTAGVEPLEADWVAIRFELKRLRQENEEMRRMLIEHKLTHVAAGVMPNDKYSVALKRSAGIKKIYQAPPLKREPGRVGITQVVLLFKSTVIAG